MIVHEIFAQIKENVVQNIMVCENYPTADYLTKAIYGSEAFAVDCLQYACQPGDSYHDGFFWRVNAETGSEEQIPCKPTEAQEIAALKEENTNLQLALVEQYEENLSLQEEVTNTQLALVELYEGGEW